MESQGSPDQDEFGSPVIIGILVVIVICSFLLGFLTARFTDWIRPTFRRSIRHPSPPSSPTSESSKSDNDLDLEAAIAENSFVTPELRNDSSSTSSELQHKNKRSLSISSRSISRDIHSLRAAPDKKKGKEKETVEISRPTRLLPANAPFVVVTSPIQPEHETSQLRMSSSTLNSVKSRNTHQRTMSDKTTTTKVGSRKSGCDELGRKVYAGEVDQMVGTSSTLTPRKRTIVRFDDQYLKKRSIDSSVRSLRSNSLPSSSSHSSWDLTPRVPNGEGDATINLGSSSQLWHNYQFQLAGS